MGFKRTNTRPEAPSPGLVLGNVFSATDDELDKAIRYLTFERDQRAARVAVAVDNATLQAERKREVAEELEKFRALTAPLEPQFYDQEAQK